MLLSIDKVEPGMELAADVMNMNDMLLMPKGAVLAIRQIRLLKTWGIESINIVGQNDGSAEEEVEVEPSPQTIASVQALVARRFRFVTATSPVVLLVKRFAARRMAMVVEREAQAAVKKQPSL